MGLYFLFSIFFRCTSKGLQFFLVPPELELEVLGLHLCMDPTTRFLQAQGRNHNLSLLDVLDHVYEGVEFGVHHGVTVALAIAQLHFGGELYNVIGLLEGAIAKNREHLMDDFDTAMNVVLGEVSMEEIIHGLS